MTYIVEQDVRDAGLPESAADANAVNAAIALWQSVLERMCRQWFEPRTATVELDGTDSDTIHFHVPIISITSLRVNNSDTELDTTYYKVYNNLTDFPDDRRNPRIKLIRSDEISDIYTRPLRLDGKFKFRKGRQNQHVEGSFGFVESDLSTPLPIKRALLKLVIEKLTNPILPDPSNPITPPPILGGPLTEEETDGHKRKFQVKGGQTKARAPGWIGITEDREILDIVKMYRAPIAMATPAHWTID